MDAGRDEKPVPVTGLDFYLAVLQQVIPSDQLVSRLVDEPYHACVISQTNMRELVDHAMVTRLLESKDQRRRLLLLQTFNDLDASFQISSVGTTPVGKGKVTKSMEVLHIDDVLDAVMNVWLKHQERYALTTGMLRSRSTKAGVKCAYNRVRDEWAVAFQRMVPDGSGVVHVNGSTVIVCFPGRQSLLRIAKCLAALKTAVRSKLPKLDDRTIMKIYHSCGQENELGEHALLAVSSMLSF